MSVQPQHATPRWMRRVECFLVGHHEWAHEVEVDPFECARCGIDHEVYMRQRDRQTAISRWCPIWLERGRWHAHLILGWPWRFYAKVGWTLGGRYGQLPAIDASARLWRLYGTVWLGGFWQVDEDGEDVSLGGLSFAVDKSGLPELICRVRGHRCSEEHRGWVYCKRCQKTLECPSSVSEHERGLAVDFAAGTFQGDADA